MSIKIKYQDQNLNKGTDKGRDMVQRSIDKFGMRDAVVIDKNGEIISGNHRKKAATKKGITKERIIEATSDEVIAIQYNDIDLDTPEGKELALALNQTAKFNINIDETLAIEELGEVVEEWGIGTEYSNIDGNEFGTAFILPSGDKSPFQQMTFTLADKQAEIIKNAIEEIKKTDEYKYCETYGNENSNGNALYLLIANEKVQR